MPAGRLSADEFKDLATLVAAEIALEEGPARRELAEAIEHAVTERFARTRDRPFTTPQAQPVSRFALEPGVASFLYCQRELARDRLPPRDAVRVEEFLNVRWGDALGESSVGETGDDAGAAGSAFTIHSEAAACPWNDATQLVRVTVASDATPPNPRPATHLVLLLDRSTLYGVDWDTAAQTLAAWAQRVPAGERVSVVAFDGTYLVTVEYIPGDDTAELRRAIIWDPRSPGSRIDNPLDAALRLARDAGTGTETARVAILTSRGRGTPAFLADADKVAELLNTTGTTGTTDAGPIGVTLFRLREALPGVYDPPMLPDDLLPQHDAWGGAMLGRHLNGWLTHGTEPLATGVTAAVEFNPARVAAYRRLGHAEQLLAQGTDHPVDGAAIHAGHRVVALYEVLPRDDGAAEPDAGLRYRAWSDAAALPELGVVRVAYTPSSHDGDTHEPMDRRVVEAVIPDAGGTPWRDASEPWRTSAGLAGFAMLLRETPYAPGLDRALVRELLDPPIQRGDTAGLTFAAMLLGYADAVAVRDQEADGPGSGDGAGTGGETPQGSTRNAEDAG